MTKQVEKHLRQRSGGTWYYQRKVPVELQGKFGFNKVYSKSLKTDSLREAVIQRNAIDARLEAQWAALKSNGAAALIGGIPEKYEALLPADPAGRRLFLDYANKGLNDAYDKGVLAIAKFHHDNPDDLLKILYFQQDQYDFLTEIGMSHDEAEEAIEVASDRIGDEFDRLLVSAALASYLQEEALQIKRGKSPRQIRNYENQKKRSIKYFIDVVGDIALLSVTRQQAKSFQHFWSDRIFEPKAGERAYSTSAGNQAISDLKILWQAIADRDQIEARNPFDGLTFREIKRKKLPYNRDWVASNWLNGSALSSLNEEARYVLLILIETGCRASEILRMPLERFQIEHPIPHIEIENIFDESVGGRVKTDASRRKTPLVGVAVPAAKALIGIGGINRYWDSGDSFSATTNKFLRENGLQQPERSVGCLRHALTESLKNDRECSDDLRRAIMGHAGQGSHERHYGEFGLQRKLEILQKHVLPFDPSIFERIDC